MVRLASVSVVGVVQLVEHLVVVQDVAGSSPVTHPNKKARFRRVFFMPLIHVSVSLKRVLFLTVLANTSWPSHCEQTPTMSIRTLELFPQLTMSVPRLQPLPQYLPTLPFE